MTLMDAALAPTFDGGPPPVEMAYWVRQLSPGWPPAFHPMPTVQAPEMVRIPIQQLQLADMVLALAILCLAAVTLAISRNPKPNKKRF